jgi:hypothetical protein
VSWGVREPKVAAIILSLLSTVGCTGMTGLMPTGPSASLSASQNVSLLAPPATQAPAPNVIVGTVNPIAAGGPRCYLGMYSCEVYPFSLASGGGVDVTLAWEGGQRDMMIQLYRADLGLVHEDLAPRTGPSRITFRRPDLGAMDYELRVVSLQRETAIPFTLEFSHWEN